MPVDLNTSTTFARTWKMSWTFTADLSPDSNVELLSHPLGLDLPGEWRLKVNRNLASEVVKIGLCHENATIGCLGEGAQLRVSLFAEGKTSKKIKSSSQTMKAGWPNTMSGWWRVAEASKRDLKKAWKGEGSWCLKIELSSIDLGVVSRPLVEDGVSVQP